MGAWRLEVAPGAPRANDRFLHVLTTGTTGVSPVATGTTGILPVAPTPQPVSTHPLHSADRDGVALTLPDGRRVELQFNRSGAVGGTISIAGAERTFSTTVQPQSGIILK